MKKAWIVLLYSLIWNGLAICQPDGVDWRHPVYETSFDDPEALRDWRLEGGKSASTEDGALVLESSPVAPGENARRNPNHLVYWLKKEVPADFLLEFTVRPSNPRDGLNIVFFNTRGIHGESIFDPALAPRDGTFSQYHSGDLNGYHISYWAGDRGTANVRKNKGFHLVAEGKDLIAGAPADAYQTVRLYKRGGKIRLTVDGELAVSYDDDGKNYGAAHTHSGWIGLRQMGRTIRCEYGELAVYPLLDGKYVAAVQEWAETLLRDGRDNRDNYGERKNPIKTPLFLDGLSVAEPHRPAPFLITREAAEERGYPTEAIPASFQQNMLTFAAFKELSKLTGDDRYLNAARETIAYALNTGTLNKDGSFTGGLLFADSRIGAWGNHATYDAFHERYVGGGGVRESSSPATPSRPNHEMEHNHIDVRMLHSVNPQALKEYLEAYLYATTLSWETLKFTRHLNPGKDYRGWSWRLTDQIDENQAVPCDTGNSPDYAGYVNMAFAFWHYRLYDEPRAWKLGFQMLKRFMDARDPNTGLGPMSYVTYPRLKPYTEVADYRRHRYSIGVASLLKAADAIFDRRRDAERRRTVLDYALEELLAYGRHKLVPGTAMQWGRIGLDGSGARDPIKVSEVTLWAYSMGYRLAEDPEVKAELWGYLRDIVKGYRLGDVGDVHGEGIALNRKQWDPIPIYRDTDDPRARLRRNNDNAYIVHAFLELYRTTGRREYLTSACFVADTLVSRLFRNGLFMRQPNSVWARTADLLPLALLDLEAAIAGKRLDASSIQPTFIRLRYKIFDNPHGGGDINDNDIYFYRTND